MAVPTKNPTSILGPDISISGQQLVIMTKGSLLIEGQIQGDVHGEAVTVGDGAYVTGVITARTIEIQGSVKGALKGSTVILRENSPRRRNLFHLEQKIACVSAAGVASGYWNSNCINQKFASDSSQ